MRIGKDLRIVVDGGPHGMPACSRRCSHSDERDCVVTSSINCQLDAMLHASRIARKSWIHWPFRVPQHTGELRKRAIVGRTDCDVAVSAARSDTAHSCDAPTPWTRHPRPEKTPWLPTPTTRRPPRGARCRYAVPVQMRSASGWRELPRARTAPAPRSVSGKPT